MNENLRCSQELAFQEIQLDEQIIRFNGNCGCVGIVRYVGGAFLDTPKEINETTLREARKYPDLFTIEEAGKKSQDVASINEVVSKAVEVPNSKAVIDVIVAAPETP